MGPRAFGPTSACSGLRAILCYSCLTLFVCPQPLKRNYVGLIEMGMTLIRSAGSCLVLLAFIGMAPVGGGSKTYVDARCSFSFEYPDTWAAVANPDAGIKEPPLYKQVARCAVGLRPRGWAAKMRLSRLVLSPYPVRVVFWSKSFARAARDSFFIRVGDIEPQERPSTLQELQPWDWGIGVRQGIDRANQFTTACCQGVRGTSWGHDRAKDGSTVTIVWEGAVVNDRHGDSLVIESDNNERFKVLVDQVVETAQFRLRSHS